jgi:hypothetical protein
LPPPLSASLWFYNFSAFLIVDLRIPLLYSFFGLAKVSSEELESESCVPCSWFVWVKGFLAKMFFLFFATFVAIVRGGYFSIGPFLNISGANINTFPFCSSTSTLVFIEDI